jgi:tryptophan-rich sensory protein
VIQCGDILPTPPPQANPDIPAAWMVLALFIAIAIFEVWALHSHHSTLSQAFRHFLAGRGFLQWLALGLMALLGVHLIFGGPI